MHKKWVYRSNGKLHSIDIQLTCMLRIYKTCNSTVRFLKYELYNKLLSGVILFRITLGITWTQPIFNII